MVAISEHGKRLEQFWGNSRFGVRAMCRDVPSAITHLPALPSEGGRDPKQGVEGGGGGAEEGAVPPFVLRLLAESAWRFVSKVRIEDGARRGFDSGLAEGERRLELLGAESLAKLNEELADVIAAMR